MSYRNASFESLLCFSGCLFTKRAVESSLATLHSIWKQLQYNDQDMATKTMSKIENLLLSRGRNGEFSKEYIESIMSSSSVLMSNILTSRNKIEKKNARMV